MGNKQEKIKEELNGEISSVERIRKIQEIKRKKVIKIAIVIASVLLIVLVGLGIAICVKNEVFSTSQSQQETEDKQKEKAVKIAIKKFKQLGEKNVKEEELEVLKIQRKGELFYFISSKENTLEVRISDNKITRVNSVIVEEQK